MWTLFLSLLFLIRVGYLAVTFHEHWFGIVKTLSKKAIEEGKPVSFNVFHKKYKIICDETLMNELETNWRPKLITNAFNSLIPGSFFTQDFKKKPELRMEKKILVSTISSPQEIFDTIIEFVKKSKLNTEVDMLDWTNELLYGVIAKSVLGVEKVPASLGIGDTVHNVSVMANEIMKNELLWMLPHKQYEIYKLRNEVQRITKKLFLLNEDTLDESKYVFKMAKHYNTSIYSPKVMNKTGIATFLAAENTVSLILYGYWKLLTNKPIFDKLRETLNGDLTYENVQNNEYLDNIINETLRYYPLVPMLLRVNPKGEIIIVPIMEIHHSSKYYSHPDEFYPDHFTKEESKNRPAHAFIPFGWGGRSCPGRNIGKLIGKAVLAYLVKNVDAEMITEPKLYKEMLNKIENGWEVSMKPRDNLFEVIDKE